MICGCVCCVVEGVYPLGWFGVCLRGGLVFLSYGKCPRCVVVSRYSWGVPGVCRYCGAREARRWSTNKTDSPKRVRGTFSPKVNPISQTGLKPVRNAYSAF